MEERSELQDLLAKPYAPRLLARRPLAAVTVKSPLPSAPAPAAPAPAAPDAVTAALGDASRWQLLMVAMLCLFAFPCTFHIYLPTFTTLQAKFWCRPPPWLASLPTAAWTNYSQPVTPCLVRVLPPNVTAESILDGSAPRPDSYQKCSAWDFDTSDVSTTIISEWDLVCDRAWLTNIAEVVFLMGVGIGGVAGGLISDRFGRKQILMSMLMAQCILSLLSLVVKTYVQYTVIRIGMGLVSVSVVYAAFVLAVELVGGRWVTVAGTCNFFPLPVAYVIVSLVSLALPDWRDLQLSLSLPGFCLLVLWFVLPESPRWLLSMGRIEEAKAILQRAADFNKRPLPSDIDKLLLAYKKPLQEERSSPLMLLRPPLLKRSLCLFVAWFAMTVAYYGLVLNTGNFHFGNIHVTSIILAVVEIPSILISIPILLKAGRRLPTSLTMLTCGAACVAGEALSAAGCAEWVMIACMMVGKFAIASTNVMMPIYTAELYPTCVRNLGVGASQMASGLALMGIPYLWNLSSISPHLPLATVAALSAVGGGVVLLLPETAVLVDCPLRDKPSSMDDSRNCNGTFTANDTRTQQ